MFVERKQLSTHLRTEFQKVFIFSIMVFEGVNTAAPYERIGRMRDWASLLALCDERPLPGGDKDLTMPKTFAAARSLLLK